MERYLRSTIYITWSFNFHLDILQNFPVFTGRMCPAKTRISLLIPLASPNTIDTGHQASSPMPSCSLPHPSRHPSLGTPSQSQSTTQEIDATPKSAQSSFTSSSDKDSLYRTTRKRARKSGEIDSTPKSMQSSSTSSSDKDSLYRTTHKHARKSGEINSTPKSTRFSPSSDHDTPNGTTGKHARNSLFSQPSTSFVSSYAPMNSLFEDQDCTDGSSSEDSEKSPLARYCHRLPKHHTPSYSPE